MITKEEALNAKISKPKKDEATGLDKSIITIGKVKYNLYQTLTNGRLKEETFEEYQIRKFFINKFKKDSKKGTIIWYSKNTQVINDYKLANYLVGLKASKGDAEDEGLKKAMANLRMMEDLAKKTNLGTYNKKKIEEFIKAKKDANRG